MKIADRGRYSFLRILLLSLTASLAGCAGYMELFEDGLAAMRGQGGTIARSDQFDSTAAQAKAIGARRPPTAWEAPVPHEAADLIQFIDESRVLVGHLEVDTYLGRPSYKELILYDAASGKKLWEAARELLPRGEYSVIAVQPLIVLLGRNEASLSLTALDPRTGERRWRAAYQTPRAHGVTNDGAHFLVVHAGKGEPQLAAIELSSGRELWSTALPASVDESGRVALLLEDKDPYVVARALLRFDRRDGRLRWAAEIDETRGAAPADAAVVSGGVLVWNANSIALVDGGARVRWRHAVREGGIKLVSSFAQDVALVVAPDMANIATGPLPTDKIEALDLKSGRSRWRHDTGGTVLSPIVQEKGLLLCSLEEAALGLDARSGARRFRTPLPAAFRISAPTNYVPAGQPDVLHLRAGKLYLSRESAGLAAFALPSGKLLWRQGSFSIDVKGYPFSTPVRVQRMHATLAMNGAALPEGPPPAAYFYQPVPSFQMQALQREYRALQFERQSALSRGDTGKAGWISQQMEVNLKMQSFNQSMEMAQQTLAAGIALSSAIESMLKNEALNGAIERLTIDINQAARLHREAFQGRYWLRPFIDFAGDKVVGVTVVNLDTGKRHDLMVSPFIQAYSQNSVEALQLAVDPRGERLLTMGVGLRPERYQPHVLWKVRLPQPSLLAYDLRRLRFVDSDARVEGRMRLAESMSVGREQQLLDAVLMNNPVATRRLLDAGADINVRTVHGYTPLMIAADAGNEVLVRLLTQRGADVKLTAQGRSALDFATDANIQELLSHAGAVKGTPLPAVSRGPVLDGGEIIDGTYRPKVLTPYAAGSGEEVAIVETPTGPAMMARVGSQGVLYRTHWRDEQGDHFSMIINLPSGQGAAYEFIVPADRRQPAQMFSYMPGTYQAVELPNGAGRRPLPRPSALYERTVLVPSPA